MTYKESLHNCLAFSPKDYSLEKRDAFIYGIIVGWDDESLQELANKFRWGKKQVDELKQLNAEFKNPDIDYIPDDYGLPEWAVRKSAGDYLEIGAHLATRDGRVCGNAFVNKIVGDEGYSAEVITDSGNVKTLTVGEIEGMFFTPRFVADINEVREKFMLTL